MFALFLKRLVLLKAVCKHDPVGVVVKIRPQTLLGQSTRLILTLITYDEIIYLK